VRRDELKALHYITKITNVRSILAHGLASHRGAEAFAHESVAMAELQDMRSQRQVPNGRMLHDYVNLYICPRNPMMRKRCDQHASLTVLQVSSEVLDLPGVVLTDSNAASRYARFYPASQGLQYIDASVVFAENWKHPEDQILEWKHSAAMCAEVLVPNQVAVQFIVGAYVSGSVGRQALATVAPGLNITVDAHMFFR
jgi:hypothetical protein